MKTLALVQQHQKLIWLIDHTGESCGDNLQLQAHWGRYLCVLAAGFLENAIGEIYARFAKQASSPPVANYVSAVVLKIQNPKAERFVSTAKAFKQDWGNRLEEFLADNGRKDAIDSIMSTRHLIAHGRDTAITVSRVRDYLDKSVEVIEFLENQCGLR